MLATADYNVIWYILVHLGFSISRKTKLKKWEWLWRSFFLFFFIFYYSRDTLDENLDDRWILFDKSWEMWSFSPHCLDPNECQLLYFNIIIMYVL